LFHYFKNLEIQANLILTHFSYLFSFSCFHLAKFVNTDKFWILNINNDSLFNIFRNLNYSILSTTLTFDFHILSCEDKIFTPSIYKFISYKLTISLNISLIDCCNNATGRYWIINWKFKKLHWKFLRCHEIITEKTSNSRKPKFLSFHTIYLNIREILVSSVQYFYLRNILPKYHLCFKINRIIFTQLVLRIRGIINNKLSWKLSVIFKHSWYYPRKICFVKLQFQSVIRFVLQALYDFLFLFI
jgi:hypothetical protein